MLYVGEHLEYKGRTFEQRGSDRELDQKLTQIMVELAMQNRSINSVELSSNHDDLPVLIAGGFDGHSKEERMQELMEFRAVDGNALFPPYHDYHSISMKFRVENIADKVVSYSRGENRSWEEIIKENPILERKRGVLPEYWVKKPNIKR